MPTIQARTRIQLETAIGYNLNAIFEGTWTAISSATTNTDTKWKGGADAANGKWLHATSGGEAGDIVRVTDDNGSGVFTHDALSGTPTVGETYILWDEEFRPEQIHSLIDNAIITVTGKTYDPVEDITIHADGKTARWDIPSGLSAIFDLQYRSKVSQKRIHDLDSVWTAGSNVTVTADTKLRKQGNASNKLVLAADVAAGGVVAYKDITAIDISKYTHIEWWARCSKTTVAADLKLLLDDTAASTAPIELLDFPILTADTWLFIRVALAKADEDTAIISVGIEDDVDIGEETVWIDDVRAVNNDESEWISYPRHLWHIDQSLSDIIIHNPAHLGYRLLKIVGGDKPALLTADSTVTEVSDDYIIAYATLQAILSHPTNALSNGGTVAFWQGRVKRAWSAMPLLQDVRLVA